MTTGKEWSSRHRVYKQGRRRLAHQPIESLIPLSGQDLTVINRSPPCLLDLPNKILGDVVSHLRPCHAGSMTGFTQLAQSAKSGRAATADLSALSRTSKRLNALTERVLYKDIHLSAFRCEKLRQLLTSIITRPELAGYIAQIVFYQPPPDDWHENFGQLSISLPDKATAKVNEAITPNFKAATGLAPRVWAKERWFDGLGTERQDARMALLIFSAVNLEELHIQYGPNQRDCMEYCYEVAGSVPRIFRRLKTVSIYGRSAGQCPDIGRYCFLPSLRKLSAWRYTSLSRVEAPALALTSLELKLVRISQEDLLPLLSRCPSLQRLSLQGNDTAHGELKLGPILTVLQSTCQLQELELRGIRFQLGPQSQRFTALSLLRWFSELKKLSISACIVMKPRVLIIPSFEEQDLLPYQLPPTLTELVLHHAILPLHMRDVLLHLSALADCCAVGDLPTLKFIWLRILYGDRQPTAQQLTLIQKIREKFASVSCKERGLSFHITSHMDSQITSHMETSLNTLGTT